MEKTTETYSRGGNTKAAKQQLGGNNIWINI